MHFNPQYPVGSSSSLAAAVFQGVEGGGRGMGKEDSRHLLRTDGVDVYTAAQDTSVKICRGLVLQRRHTRAQGQMLGWLNAGKE